MICGVCGGSGTVLRSKPQGKFRHWFRPCPGACGGSGSVTDAQLKANPRPNQLDWYGAFFERASTYFTSEVPAYAGKWFGPLARCAVWDGRDEFEFALEAA